jgi:hypothetical protein
MSQDHNVFDTEEDEIVFNYNLVMDQPSAILGQRKRRKSKKIKKYEKARRRQEEYENDDFGN